MPVFMAGLAALKSPCSDKWASPGPYAARNIKPNQLRKDIYFSGVGRISGVISNGGKPVSRRVQIFSANESLLVAEVWSGSDGVYAFSNLDKYRTYSVIAYDHEKNKRAVVADNVRPVV